MLTGSTYLAAENEALKQKLAEAKTIILAAQVHIAGIKFSPSEWVYDDWLKDADKFLNGPKDQTAAQ